MPANVRHVGGEGSQAVSACLKGARASQGWPSSLPLMRVRRHTSSSYNSPHHGTDSWVGGQSPNRGDYPSAVGASADVQLATEWPAQATGPCASLVHLRDHFRSSCRCASRGPGNSPTTVPWISPWRSPMDAATANAVAAGSETGSHSATRKWQRRIQASGGEVRSENILFPCPACLPGSSCSCAAVRRGFRFGRGQLYLRRQCLRQLLSAKRRRRDLSRI